MNDTQHIYKIQNGTVIDHIRRGFGKKILQFIGTGDDVIVMGINLASNKYNLKDILKYANRELRTKEEQLIATLSPEATVSTIRDWAVVNKKSLSLPDRIEGIIKCPNPKCITNSEIVTTIFSTQPTIRCHYCERSIKPSELFETTR